MSYRLRLLMFGATILALLFSALPVGAEEPAFGHPAFGRVWQRYDKPVSDLVTSRSWTWGPNTYLTGTEPYAEAPGGKRLVQYFDKSRMEMTTPDADPNTPWFVTNGLLATELITGRLQVGDNLFEQRWPAQIPIAGDPDDTGGPLYDSFSRLTAEPVSVDSVITATINRQGTTGSDARLASYGVKAAYLVPETKHTVAAPFWEFLNTTGPVYANNSIMDARLFDPTFFVTGFPVTEAYWARVKVAGTVQDVLVQCYERRCLTYTPANPAGFKVEMGNIGQHYHRWRYSMQSGNILLQDDFSDPAGSWPRATHAEGSVDYVDGAYRILVTKADASVWAEAGPRLADVRVEADATFVAGPAINSYGLICRYQDAKNYYSLEIGGDGFYGIYKAKAGEYTRLTPENATSGAIRKGAATNRLRADCIGNTLSLFVNGQKVAEVQDNEFAAGSIGMTAGAFEGAGTDVRFDNLVVLKP